MNMPAPGENDPFSKLLEMFAPGGKAGQMDAGSMLSGLLDESGLGPLFEALAGFLSQVSGQKLSMKNLLGLEPWPTESLPTKNCFTAFTNDLAERADHHSFSANPKAAILDEVGKLADNLKLAPAQKKAFITAATNAISDEDVSAIAANPKGFSDVLKSAYGEILNPTKAAAPAPGGPAPADTAPAQNTENPSTKIEEGGEIGYGVPVPVKANIFNAPVDLYSMGKGGDLTLHETVKPQDLSKRLGGENLEISLVKTADSQGELSNTGYRLENRDTGLGYYLDASAVPLTKDLVAGLTREAEPTAPAPRPGVMPLPSMGMMG
ncbi:MAG: hypothetical protein K9G62_05485 [Alphaproteobacteria bacterium]|nr:hypothetical protein [Alphaproteobacteria bacterium]